MVFDEYSWVHHEDSTDDGEGSEVTRKDLSADREADPTAAGSAEDSFAPYYEHSKPTNGHTIH
ncbi:hypothetical protein PPTG_22673 [Phytophthora nicotianae INRA-310]|uniref:Uncharacterized protein n=1 Tax=Phytophthora nicotianae (strain INRA-310) TaxID=761204 RepID=W2QBY2_PHYN3|nr:hypothetical protein PPTG_22673 [Phytophthora nicotianae INRA-310]ETN10672.1 hypothetical protein PPTG_22673 [Phytophthora nicotianae INRA-310]